jgi:MFS family permease
MREAWGYQTVVQILAVVGIVLAGITYWIIPHAKNPAQTTVISDIKAVLSNKRVIWSCIFAGLMVGSMEGFADVWSTAFLKQVYGLDGAFAASLPSMIYIGMCFGGPVLSMIADKMGSYLATIIGAGIVMAIGFSAMLAWNLTPGMLTVSFVLIGVCCAYQILAIYKASTYVPEHIAGLTTAVANMIIMTFGYAFHTVIGAMINAMGGPSSSQAFVYGLSVIPLALCLGIAGFGALFVQEKREVLE